MPTSIEFIVLLEFNSNILNIKGESDKKPTIVGSLKQCTLKVSKEVYFGYSDGFV